MKKTFKIDKQGHSEAKAIAFIQMYCGPGKPYIFIEKTQSATKTTVEYEKRN